ncbi:hypothetical protein ACFY2Z_32725 [Streptomyces sp. NPDC001222]|uniref:hypothetical protein n=1 Tax=Streptomyces sp. NPDC001222 TaxID=3364548 RepID=UPI003695B197
MRVVQLITAPVAAFLAVAGLAASATADTLQSRSSHSRHFQVRRDHPDVRVPIVVSRSGEAVLDLNAAAPGTDWAVAGAESAVVSISDDGHHAADLVASGGQPLHRQLALGHLTAGVHKLRLHFSDESSPAAATSALSAPTPAPPRTSRASAGASSSVRTTVPSSRS